MATTQEKLQRNLVKFRDAAKLKNEQLADLAGIPLGTLQKLVNGQRKIQGEDIEPLAAALGIDPGSFYADNPTLPSPVELPPIWLKTGPDVPPDIKERARQYERELRRDFMARVHEKKKPPTPPRPPATPRPPKK